MSNNDYKCKIPVKNIYYMLSYAYNILKHDNYSDLGEEDFDNIYELLSEVLIRGIRKIVKQGIYKEYVNMENPLSAIRGKISIGESLKLKMRCSPRLQCVYDEFSSNNILNKIIKSTCMSLIRNPQLNSDKKRKLKNLMFNFAEVEELNLRDVEWSRIRYNKNNLTYKMLIDICYLIYDGLIVNEESGRVKFAAFLKDKMMAKLYEKFVYEFYKQEFPQFTVRYQEQIKWKSDDGFIYGLPNMNTDISLIYNNHKLIIDTKFYAECMQKNYLGNNKSFISANLYQIFAYVKNSTYNGIISGMLLYPTVEYDVQSSYMLSGNKICIRTVDLNKDFTEIRKRLIDIAEDLLLSE